MAAPSYTVLALVAAVALAACEGGSLTGLLSQGENQQPPTEAVEALPEPTPLPGVGPVEAAPDVEIALAEPQPTEYRVALLGPLSGPDAAIGRDLLDAAQMSVFELAGRDFALIPHDTQGTPAGARAAAQAAIDDGAQLILGPLFATSVQAVAPIARGRSVNVISFSNTREVAGNGIYVMGFLPRPQIARAVRFGIAQGLARFAAAAPSSAYGTAMVQELADAVEAFGATVTRVEYYDPGAEDYSDVVRALADFDARRRALDEQRRALAARDDEVSREALRRLEGRDTIGDVDYDALLVPAAGQELLKLAPLLPFFDIDTARVRLIGTWQWDVEGIGVEPALLGAWFAAPPRETRVGFEQQFETLYGRRPNRLSTLAFDATALAAVVALQAGPIPNRREAFSREKLTAPNGFAGIDGVFRILPSGEVERGLAVLQVARDGARVIDPAPTSFETPIN